MQEFKTIIADNIFVAKKILFYSSFGEIQGIKFTLREIYVLACLLHNRGEKKIAQLLGISPRTVETHINKIKLKLSGCTREYIIDFIESSGKINLFRQFYGYLSIQRCFEDTLSKIKDSIKTTIYYKLALPLEPLDDKIVEIVQELQNKLALVNINKTTKADQDAFAVTISVATTAPDDIKPSYIYITFDKENNAGQQVVNFSDKENFYTSLLRLIFAISDPQNIAPSVIAEFEKTYKVFYNSWIDGKKFIDSIKIRNSFNKTVNVKILLFWVIISITILLSIAAIIRYKSNFANNAPIKLEVPLLSNSIYLKRPLLTKQMDQILQGASGIGIVALVGIGGAGKTTLAQQYAYSQTNASLIWEINANSQENIINSFEHLAYSFCQTADEKKEFSKIQEIANRIKREKMLYSFLISKVKKYPNWIIIYDNVENIKDIQQYLPRHKENWGKGSVIITTTNSNIVHNNIIDSNIINIPELSNEEKLQLFNKIYCADNYDNLLDTDQATKVNFLAKLPPFPLDISTAAHYLKNTRMSYDNYLMHIQNASKNFINSQKLLLSDISDYNKTRHNIVTLSIEQIINSHKNTIELLLLTSSLSSQNIPKDLLISYKGELLTNQLIHQLLNFSFIEDKGKYFSINPTVQAITLNYLTKLFLQRSGNGELANLAQCVEQYMAEKLAHKNDIVELNSLINHIESLKSNNKLFDFNSLYGINNELGNYYYRVNNNINEAINILEHNLEIANNSPNYDQEKVAKNLIYLGTIYGEKNLFQDAENLLIAGVEMYTNLYGREHPSTLWAITCLGNDYGAMGKLQKADKLLLEASSSFEKIYGKNHPKSLWALTCLANNYINMDKIKEANDILTFTSEQLKNLYGENKARFAWSLSSLGNSYIHLGHYDKALEMLDKALEIFRTIYDENYKALAWTLLALGDAHHDIQNYQLAEKHLNEAINTFKYLYGTEDLVAIADCFSILGSINEKMNNNEKALEYLKKASSYYLHFFPENNYKKLLISLRLAKLQKKLGLPTITDKAYAQNLAILIKHYGADHKKLVDVTNGFDL